MGEKFMLNYQLILQSKINYMITILNTWQSRPNKRVYYEFAPNSEIYRNGDYAAYPHWNGSIIYTFKNIAINNLGGLNKEHIDRLANNQRPTGEFNNNHFLFDRAIENKNAGLSLLPQLNTK